MARHEVNPEEWPGEHTCSVTKAILTIRFPFGGCDDCCFSLRGHIQTSTVDFEQLLYRLYDVLLEIEHA